MFDGVPQEVEECSIRKLRVEDWFVRVVMAMYDCPKTSVR